MSRAAIDHRDRVDARQGPESFDGKKWTYGPLDAAQGRIRFTVRSGGCVMCRKPRCAPFVLTEKEWAKLPIYESNPNPPSGEGKP